MLFLKHVSVKSREFCSERLTVELGYRQGSRHQGHDCRHPLLLWMPEAHAVANILHHLIFSPAGLGEWIEPFGLSKPPPEISWFLENSGRGGISKENWCSVLKHWNLSWNANIRRCNTLMIQLLRSINLKEKITQLPPWGGKGWGANDTFKDLKS